MGGTKQNATKTVPTWRYDTNRGVLHVHGGSFHHDLQYVWELIDTGRVPFLLDAIVHIVESVGVPMLVTGHYLSEWLVDRVCPDFLWHLETQAMRKSA